MIAVAVGAAALALTSAAGAATAAGAEVRVTRNVAYGPLAAERFDVYAPPHARGAPVILMVHGGGWRRGDKAASGVVDNKVARWVSRGFVLISTNYPLLPGTPPLEQARYVGKALAFAERHAGRWGASGSRFILMGHSAGAHLVSLISAEPSLATSQGAKRWLGTISLDSAAFDIRKIMEGPHLSLYDEAFGSDPATWAADSPLVQLDARIAPFLAVCSSLRAESCGQARAFVAKAKTFGTHAKVLPEALRHGSINADLGLPSAYTARVESFMRTLGPAVARLLRRS